MKRLFAAIVAGTCLLFAGCSSVQQVLRVTQSIEATKGTVTTAKPFGVTVAVTVENARQEDGQFKADELHVVATSPLGKTELHLEGYSRPLIKEGN